MKILLRIGASILVAVVSFYAVLGAAFALVHVFHVTLTDKHARLSDVAVIASMYALMLPALICIWSKHGLEFRKKAFVSGFVSLFGLAIAWFLGAPVFITGAVCIAATKMALSRI
jgi:glucan phosphoethanolaminetransferase (alkaline phosphatase superfamily)